MSSGRNDLEIVISRVDDICKYLNNFKKTNKNTIDRIDKLEEKYKTIGHKKEVKELGEVKNEIDNGELDKKFENIVQRLEYVESNAAKNNEEIDQIIEAKVKQTFHNHKSEFSATRKNMFDKNTELERKVKYIQCEHVNLQKGIHDLDEQISNLDKQYRSIEETLELQKSKLHEKGSKVSQMESNIDSMKA